MRPLARGGVHPTAIKIDEGFMALKSPAGAEAMDDRLAEHVLDRCGQGLGSVEDGQDGPAGVQAEVSRSPVIRSVTTAAFSVELHPERVLGPVDAVQPFAHQLGQGLSVAATNRLGTADSDVAAATSSTACPAGSSPWG